MENKKINLNEEQVNEFVAMEEKILREMTYEQYEELEAARVKAEEENVQFNKGLQTEILKVIGLLVVGVFLLSFGMVLTSVSMIGVTCYFIRNAYKIRKAIHLNDILIGLLEDDIIKYRSM